MSAPAWTPGRWLAAAKPSSVVGWPVVSSPTGRSICSVSWQAKPPHVSDDDYAAFAAECAANASLIAAAPDLSEALAELVLYHDVPSEAQDPVVLPLIRAAFAALSKARGDQS